MQFDLSHELDENDLAGLEALFAKLDLTIEWVEGLFTTFFIGPDLVPPSAWYKEVLGDYQFETVEEAQTILPLLNILYNDVGRRLRFSTDDVCPPPDDSDAVADFCHGIVTGARMQPAWLASEEALMMIFPFGALCEEFPEEDIDLDGAITDVAEWKQKQREKLGVYLEDLRAYFNERRGRRPARANAKVGRNDPCPCGSGKKNKKCCGAN